MYPISFKSHGPGSCVHSWDTSEGGDAGNFPAKNSGSCRRTTQETGRGPETEACSWQTPLPGKSPPDCRFIIIISGLESSLALPCQRKPSTEASFENAKETYQGLELRHLQKRANLSASQFACDTDASFQMPTNPDHGSLPAAQHHGSDSPGNKWVFHEINDHGSPWDALILFHASPQRRKIPSKPSTPPPTVR